LSSKLVHKYRSQNTGRKARIVFNIGSGSELTSISYTKNL
jgi:hypothetical protein